ncbi:SYP71, partial [Linum grandiflorum]
PNLICPFKNARQSFPVPIHLSIVTSAGRPSSPLSFTPSILILRRHPRNHKSQRKERRRSGRMSVIDLITRVDSICRKFDKYDVDKQTELNVTGEDAFARLYSSVQAELDSTIQKADSVASAKNRAAVVAINAEIRRTKARLLDDIPKLQRLAMKKVRGLSMEEMEARSDLVSALKDRIASVPDGSSTAAQQSSNGGGASASSTGMKFNSNYDGSFDDAYFQKTDESDRFRQEYEMRKMKQDEGLDFIAEGLDTLKDMAHDMNEELDRQVPLMDEIDDKVDKAASDLRSTNVRLKDTVNQLRSSRNFCIDIVLLCVVLGIAAYLYNVYLQCVEVKVLRIVKRSCVVSRGTSESPTIY